MLPATFASLALFTLAYAAIWTRALLPLADKRPTLPALLTGFVTNFFDTLGIGSFATTTSIFKFTRMVPDQLIPGTLNAGHTLPTIFQAFIYIAVIQVDPSTLLLMIAGAVVGSWFGAAWVARLPKRNVQLGVGGALLFAAVALLMMGSSAFLMPVASARFVQSGKYSPTVALGLTLGGLLGVPLAAFVVKSLPLTALRWLVIVVILYAAVRMLRSAYTESHTA